MSIFTPTKILLAFLIVISALLHFYNLNWGAPFYFHPDERNVASAVSQLQFPNQMNPHFFAYGSLPIYTIYFTGLLANYSLHSLQPTTYNLQPTFDQAIIISRLYSALFATLLIPLLFFIGKKIKNEEAGLFAALLGATSVGLIQFAHFGTFEMWLTFFGVLLFLLCMQEANRRTILLMGIVLGILIATKASSVVLMPLPLLATLMSKIKQGSRTRSIMTMTSNLFLFLIASLFVYIISNPYVLLDTTAFLSSMRYESSVALGTLPVFYTGEFFNAIPVLFQFQNIYPFLLNPLVTVLFIPSFFYLIFKALQTKNFNYFLLFLFYALLFFPQAFLFVKWTRYMVPTLPFMYLIIAIALIDFSTKFKTFYSSSKGISPHREVLDFARTININHVLLTIFITVTSVFALSYFITAFVEPDTRIAAKTFAQHTIPMDSPILSEVYDLGITPFNGSFGHIELFNFYDLDSDPTLSPELQTRLTSSQYVILPSQRVLKVRLLNKKKFPTGYDFYTALIRGKLGYKRIYTSPCSIFCTITYLGDPVFRYEQTASVFERPTSMIFQKMQ